MGKITKDEVLKLAELSKIALSNDQVDKFRLEFESLLEYIEQLQSVDTEGLEPTNQVTGLKNVFRKDEIIDRVKTEELLKNLPNRDGNQIKVRRVLD